MTVTIIVGTVLGIVFGLGKAFTEVGRTGTAPRVWGRFGIKGFEWLWVSSSRFNPLFRL